ncbi:MAG TPA: hypothetical protein VIS72_13130, partial [Anaerolineales bacterium]
MFLLTTTQNQALGQKRTVLYMWGRDVSTGVEDTGRAFLKSCQTTLASTDSVTFTAILSKNAKKKKEIVGLVVHAFGTLIK